MARGSTALKMTLAYDGTGFAGWQIQTRAGSGPTVQGTLEDVLQRLFQKRVAVTGSGRTDAGVHALGQVAHCRIPKPWPLDRLQRSLNQLLPGSIRVMRLEPAPPGFHARYDALSKRYRYRIATPPVPPFDRLYVWPLDWKLDGGRMRAAAADLVGKHDFRGFTKAGTPRGTVREISAASVNRRSGEWRFEIEGNGFLHLMVRSIAGTLVEIGRGAKEPSAVAAILKSGDRKLAGATAPASGLCLMSVTYPAAKKGGDE